MARRQSVSFRVLVADHDPRLLETYRRFFPPPCDLAGATSGLECVVQLRRFQPHVLVLEPSIPWGGGAGVLAQMHSDLHATRVTVIILTACREFAALSAVLNFPLHDFAFKPLSPEQLAYKIRNAVNNLPLDPDRLSQIVRHLNTGHESPMRNSQDMQQQD